MSGWRILRLSDAPAAQNAITECGLTVAEDPAQVRPESSREGLPWLNRNRFLQREASIVIVEFELVLAMMNGSISAERALEAWGAAAVQRCGSKRGLAPHPLPGSERRRFADLNSWRGRSASPVIRHTLAA